MQIHLSDISSCEGKCVQVTAPLEMDCITFQMGSFSVLHKEPLELTITNTGKKVLELVGTGGITVSIPCDRCLEDVSVEIPLSFKRKLDMKLTEEERVNDLDENAYLTGMDLDVDQLVYFEVLMNWPLKVLCKEDCKGICSQCGKNLNEGLCDCVEEPKDPRMAAISDIFSKLRRCNICPSVQRIKHLKLDVIREEELENDCSELSKMQQMWCSYDASQSLQRMRKL